MKRLLLLAALCTPWLAQAQTLNVKTGAWEMTLKGSLMPKPMVYQECITKADLAEMVKGPDKDDDCKLKKPFTASGQKWSGEMACGEGSLAVEFSTDAPDRVHGIFVQTSKQGRATMDLSGRWLSASCAGIKE